MKKLLLMGAIATLATTLFSCTADEYETADKKTEVNKENNIKDGAKADDGPGDQPIIIKPPK